MEKYSKARHIILIVRGEKPEHHKAPYHPIIVCTQKHTARWESQRTCEGDTVFVNMSPDSHAGNWLLVKYKGYDIDYGNVANYFTLFDGLESKDVSGKEKVESLIKGAIWWSCDNIPEWFKELGVVYADDDFTKKRILQDAGTCLLTETKSQLIKSKRKKYDKPHWL